MHKIYFTSVFKLKNCEILQTKGCQSQHYKNAFKVNTLSIVISHTTVLHTTIGPVNVYKISEGQNW